MCVERQWGGLSRVALVVISVGYIYGYKQWGISKWLPETNINDTTIKKKNGVDKNNHVIRLSITISLSFKSWSAQICGGR